MSVSSFATGATVAPSAAARDSAVACAPPPLSPIATIRRAASGRSASPTGAIAIAAGPPSISRSAELPIAMCPSAVCESEQNTITCARSRVVGEVAYGGSVSAAAQALSYTQSAVSQQIATLEAEAGIALLERHPRGVTLTAAGQTLVGHAEGILARLDAAEAALEAIA